MSLQAKILHHIHLRKRVHLKKQHYPSKKRGIRTLDNLAYVAGVLTPVFTIPQFLEIWLQQNAAGVSFFTWASYLLLSIFWTIYGVVHKEKPIIVMYASQATIQIFIVYGIFLYR